MRLFRTLIMLILGTVFLSGCDFLECGKSDCTTTTELEGKWKTPCRPAQGDISGSEHFQIEFEGNEVTMLHYYYALDDDCSFSFFYPLAIVKSFHGNFFIGDEVTTASGVTARELDLFYLEGDAPSNVYTIYYKQDGAHIYLGEADTGKIIRADTEAKRHTDLNYLEPYRKKEDCFGCL